MIKRLFDVFVAAVALVLLAPMFAAVALLVRRRFGRPVIFAHQRPGLNGRPFTLYKFKTLLPGSDATGRILPDSERLTPFGAWLRSTSLDELPGLWNVLRGDMSLVGPRPLLMEYLGRYSPEQARRHEVKPGITGWTQVNGRNALSWPQKFTLDLWYVDHQNFWLDLRILWLTILKVIRRDGIAAPGEATMPIFWGNDGASEDETLGDARLASPASLR